MWSWRVARPALRSAELAAVLTLSLFFAALAAGQAPPAAQQPPARKSPFEEVQEPKPEPPKPPAAPRNPFEDVQEPKPEAPKPGAAPATPEAPKPDAGTTTLGREDIVERIEVLGNRRIPRDALLSRLYTKQGDPYNEEQLRRDMMLLWNTAYFDDVRVTSTQGHGP